MSKEANERLPCRFFFLHVMLLCDIHPVQTASARLVHAPCHRHRFLPGLAALLAAVGLVACNYSHGALPVALVQEHIAHDQHARHRVSSGHRSMLPYVPSKQLLGDLKKVLIDVETNIKYRRERRRQELHSQHHAHATAPPATSKDLHAVDHLMDNLESLAGESSAHDTHSEEGRRGRGRGRGEAPSRRPSEKQQAETRIITRRNAPIQMNAAAKKKEKILAKMKALQSQILGDFKKVTGFGKKAGYVPPPKIPSM